MLTCVISYKYIFQCETWILAFSFADDDDDDDEHFLHGQLS